jgi:hypothetical protein
MSVFVEIFALRLLQSRRDEYFDLNHTIEPDHAA